MSSENSKPIVFHSRFMTLPTRALRDVRDGKMPPLGLAVMGALSSHVSEGRDGDDWVFCGLDRVGDMIGVSKSSAQRVMSTLIELGYVQRELRGLAGGGKGRGKTHYRVVLDAPSRPAKPQNPDMGFEESGGEAQNPKSGLKTQKEGSKPTLGGTEILNLNNSAHTCAREDGFVSGEAGQTADPIARLIELAEGQGNDTSVRRWLKTNSPVWRGNGVLEASSGTQKDRLVNEFYREIRAVARELGLANGVRVVWQQEESRL